MAGVVPLAIRTGGESAAYGYIVPGAILLLFAAGFTAMSPMTKNAGAFYSCIARGLGRPLGIGIGIGSGSALVALVAYNAMAVCPPADFAYCTANTFSSPVGVDVPRQPIAVVGTAAVAFLGLVPVWRSVSPLDLLTAAGSAVNRSLPLPLPVLFLVGAVMALRVRRRDPVLYESLGTRDVEG